MNSNNEPLVKCSTSERKTAGPLRFVRLKRQDNVGDVESLLSFDTSERFPIV